VADATYALDEDPANDVSSQIGDEPRRFLRGECGQEAISPFGVERELRTDPFALGGNGSPHRFDRGCIRENCRSHGPHNRSLVGDAPKPHVDLRQGFSATSGSSVGE
jgi:hypothetical protein